MRLWYYRGAYPNFGDELNPWLWGRLLPTIGDGTGRPAEPLFLGIGSILFDRFSSTERKVVFGAGYGGFTAPPDIHDGSWTVRFVRGPQTARILGLDPALAIADPAVLMNLHAPAGEPVAGRIGFVPHWESMGRGYWARACKLAGIELIDPRDPVERVLEQLGSCEVVLAEALHGAIVADALRIPWIAVTPIDPRQRLKWHDWAGSLDFTLRPRALFPTSWAEAHLAQPHFRLGRGAVRVLRAAPGGQWLESFLVEAAASRLVRLSKAEPMLSPECALRRAIDRVGTEVERLQDELVRQPARHAA